MAEKSVQASAQLSGEGVDTRVGFGEAEQPAQAGATARKRKTGGAVHRAGNSEPAEHVLPIPARAGAGKPAVAVLPPRTRTEPQPDKA